MKSRGICHGIDGFRTKSEHYNNSIKITESNGNIKYIFMSLDKGISRGAAGAFPTIIKSYNFHGIQYNFHGLYI